METPLQIGADLPVSLDKFARTVQEYHDCTRNRAPSVMRRRLLRVLAEDLGRASTDSLVTVPAFAAVARATKLIVVSRHGRQLADAAVWVERARMPEVLRLDSRACAMMKLLSETTITRDGTRENDIATRLLIHRTLVGRILRAATGFGFRELRWACRIRPSISLLIDTDERIRQVAFRSGYRHPVQFHREFRRVVGVSPGGFKELVDAP